MTSKWRVSEQLAQKFGHEWAGFYTWLANAAEGWNKVEQNDLAKIALPLIDAFEGETPMGIESVKEAYFHWLYEIVGASPNLPAGIWPCLIHTTGTGRLEWEIQDETAFFWVHRPTPPDELGRPGAPHTVIEAEVEMVDGYWKVNRISFVHGDVFERHAWALCEALGAFLPTGEVAKHTAKMWLSALDCESSL